MTNQRENTLCDVNATTFLAAETSSLSNETSETTECNTVERRLSFDSVAYPVPASADNSTSKLKNFFPATTDAFQAKCGTIESLKESDFLDVYRRRHLDSFKQSWDEWASFDATKRNVVPEEPVIRFVQRLIEAQPQDAKQLRNIQRALRRELHIAPSKSQMLAAYELLTAQSKSSPILDQFLVKKLVRTHSGVVVITVLTSPGSFSCPQDCHYCPNEPGQPRSYLSTEPAVLRANQNGWDPAAQFWDRAGTLQANGHTIDKIEILVLGGTWSGYPKAYQEEFIRDLFFAANTFHVALSSKQKTARDAVAAATSGSHTQTGLRPRLTLEEEQRINQNADCRIIGLTLETRPDHISPGELRRLRRFGCTRVQIGIQHTDDVILAKINRGCYLRHAIRAIRLLKDACFKVDIHLMPDLPGSNPEQDKQMFERILSSVSLQADQWKIYPCEVTPFSEIEKWYKAGSFVPYAEYMNGLWLTQLLVKVKTAVHPWIRLNRVVRDIPNPSIIAGNDKTNLRQMLLSCMDKRGLICRCLRCREVKTKLLNPEYGHILSPSCPFHSYRFSNFRNAVLKIREYPSFGGVDYFLSFETHDESTLFAFLRLRLRTPQTAAAPLVDDTLLRISDIDLSDGYDFQRTFPELEGCGLVRELHVYGQLVGSKEQKTQGDARPQHTGFGKRLLAAAELLTLSHKQHKMAVIAGVGTTEYYRKFGYDIENYFMTKRISAFSVLRTAAHLQLLEPLKVQVYNVHTELGPLLSSQEPAAHPSTNAKQMQDSPGNNSSTVTTDDILSCIQSNCKASTVSHAVYERILNPYPLIPRILANLYYALYSGHQTATRVLEPLPLSFTTISHGALAIALTGGLALLWYRRQRSSLSR